MRRIPLLLSCLLLASALSGCQNDNQPDNQPDKVSELEAQIAELRAEIEKGERWLEEAKNKISELQLALDEELNSDPGRSAD